MQPQSKDTNANDTPSIVASRDCFPGYHSAYTALRKRVAAVLMDSCANRNLPEEKKRELVRELRPRFPLAACFNVHSVCNLLCIMCPYRTTPASHKAQRMAPEVFARLLAEFHSIGGRIFTFNNFSDIFADKSAYAYLETALQYRDRMQMYLVTNGVGMDKGYVDYLFDAGFEGIMYVSCHGFSKETYKKTTGKDFFERVKANIEYLLARHPFPERIIMQYATDFSTNEELMAAIAYWKGKGCHVNAFRTHSFAGNSGHKSLATIDGPLVGCGETWGVDAGLPFYQIVIQPDGTVSLCCMDLLASVKLGNVISDGIQTVWNSKVFMAIVEKLYCGGTLPKNFICRRCSARPLR